MVRPGAAALAAPARPSTQGFYDTCMKGEAKFSLGFMKPNGAWPFGSSSAYGAPGAGGSFAFTDPEAKIGYAYVTNRMGVKITGDPRDIALRDRFAICDERNSRSSECWSTPKQALTGVASLPRGCSGGTADGTGTLTQGKGLRQDPRRRPR